jgi:Polyketide cyclase / dehydrase and lipid transport
VSIREQFAGNARHAPRYARRVAGAALPASGEVTVSVAAPPEVIWAFAADPSVPARFSEELEAASFADGAGPLVGAVIVGTNRNSAFTWTTESTVTDCVAPSLFRWATGDPADPTATWTFAIAPSDGGALLTHAVELHAGRPPLGPAIEAEPDRAHEIVRTRMAKVLANMALTATGIAALAEAAAAR